MELKPSGTPGLVKQGALLIVPYGIETMTRWKTIRIRTFNRTLWN